MLFHLRKKKSQYHPILSTLSPLNRGTLKKALDGDVGLITQLIADWEVDAQLLELSGRTSIKRLPREQYLRSQIIGRQILNLPSDSLQRVRDLERDSIVIDDLGMPLEFCHTPQRILPQTFVSASVLLALTTPQQIAALPKGLRGLKSLFPEALTNQIPYDLDRYHSEKLFLSAPEVAFVADYSNPSLLSALQAQGIRLFTLKHTNRIEEVAHVLKRIGHVVDRSLEAELLTMFMEAAMFAIEIEPLFCGKIQIASPIAFYLSLIIINIQPLLLIH